MPISVGLNFLRKLKHTKKAFKIEKKWVLELYIQKNLIHSNLEESDIKLILDCAPRYNEKELYPEFSTKSYSSLTKYNRSRESLEQRANLEDFYQELFKEFVRILNEQMELEKGKEMAHLENRCYTFRQLWQFLMDHPEERPPILD